MEEEITNIDENEKRRQDYIQHIIDCIYSRDFSNLNI